MCPVFWQEIRAKKQVKFESEHCTANGDIYPVAISAHYYIDGDKEFIIGFARDLSDIKNKERDFSESEKEILSEQKSLRTRLSELVENVPGAFFQYHLDGKGGHRIEFMSPGSMDIWELTPEEIANDSSQLWDMVVSEDFEAIQQSIVASEKEMKKWIHEWRIVTPSGKKKWLRGVGNPHKDESGLTF